MRHTVTWGALLLAAGAAFGAEAGSRGGGEAVSKQGPPCISGVYPHLAVFNGSFDAGSGAWRGTGAECGIGAVVPWAGKLWLITYPPHATRGSDDKLWTIDAELKLEMRPESVGGTHACRAIHRESNQLIIGPYFVDAGGNVRAADVKRKLVGRMTAVMRHLTDPADKVYFFDMEGAIYEVNVHSLAVKKLFAKPVPGWHGKGGYSGQGRVIIANNGERSASPKAYGDLQVGGPPKHRDEIGCLAEWDGREWRIVERKQFLDVTGPGGLYGAPDEKAPVWSIGWDRRSCILKLLDGGRWQTFRLPKASYCFDPAHGWYTEWPRIRQVGGGAWMMDLHGMFFAFPPGFRAGRTGGLVPIASHLRYIPDFCEWNGRVVLAADEASIMKNPMCGKAQSNLWFGRREDLRHWGPAAGWGGPWVGDAVKAGETSAPFAVGGLRHCCLHLSTNIRAGQSVPVRRTDEQEIAGPAREASFAVEADLDGSGRWTAYKTLSVPASGYAWHVFPPDFAACWVRLRPARDCVATAYFHCASPRDARTGEDAIFAAVAKAPDAAPVCAGLIRPAGHNTHLQFLAQVTGADGRVREAGYWEVDEAMKFHRVEPGRADEVRKVAAVRCDFDVDAASVILTYGGRRWRLPKGDASFDRPLATGWPRGIRECQSERYLVNVHGTLYEMPRDTGVPHIKPVCTHNRRIVDFCSWRGLLVVSGTRRDARPDGQYFASADGEVGLWFGQVDDLWRLGRPVGRGGPWHRTPVKADTPSEAYLMTGFADKTVELSHDAAGEVRFTVEVDFLGTGQWERYATMAVPAGRTLRHEFPAGFGAHWVRLRAGRNCLATARFLYGVGV
jgi:hypothetical protein